MHFHRSTHDEIINNNPCVLIKDDDGNLFKRYFNYTTYNASSPEVKLDLSFKCTLESFKILSSCNGLILFQSGSTLDGRVLCIWNPCTKEYKVLPKPLKFYCDKVTYGFGYDHTIDDYKVIRNAYIYHDRNGNYETANIQVYTLRSDTWRSINERMPNSITGFFLQDVGVFVNGAFYWIIDERLISFDIEKEKYQEISKEPAGIDLFCGKLVVFEGSLCLYTTDISGHRSMYLMNKETYSWTKVCTMPRVPSVPVIKPLRLTENGNILMVGVPPSILRKMMWGCPSPSDLILVNPKKKISMNFNIGDECYVQEVYIESLVSLNSGIYVGDRVSKGNENYDAGTKRRKGNTGVCVV